ncbi:hypothetical protein RFN29_15910 [Mesorhizobium sp. VK22B]|uniref:Uncharacterized protein n=1 Tax=Mesorhizobium captivum TaxID=3072319 RepID=A0ABU4Z3A2_9HYPH|nr:hypothetical protein [Mesorhizobium sp. VK22E]MDX8493058.1 hypothetical protein [Mesorhizobium sp. VK22B]
MSAQVIYRAFGAKEVRQLKEVYDRARSVHAKYSESHVAGRAARKLIDAFEAVIGPDGTVLNTRWLNETDPQGHA